MNTYTVTFTTPIIRGSNLKPRIVEVQANNFGDAERRVFCDYQGVQVTNITLSAVAE